MSIDYSERPSGMSRAAWANFTDKMREAEVQRQRNIQKQKDEAFELHMRYDNLTTKELTWLRDRIVELQGGH